MNVDDPLGKSAQKFAGEDAHEAGEDDPIAARPGEHGDEGMLEGRAIAKRFVLDDGRGDAGRLRPREARCVGAVRDDEPHARIEGTGGNGVEDGLQVGATARDEDAELEGHEGYCRPRGIGSIKEKASLRSRFGQPRRGPTRSHRLG